MGNILRIPGKRTCVQRRNAGREARRRFFGLEPLEQRVMLSVYVLGQSPEVYLFEWCVLIGKPHLYQGWLDAGRPPIRFELGGRT